jgi:hypothetical protein
MNATERALLDAGRAAAERAQRRNRTRDVRGRPDAGAAGSSDQGQRLAALACADGRWLAIDGADAVVRRFDAHSQTEVRKLQMDQQSRDMALRPDGKVLAVPATYGPGEGYVDILSVRP